MEEILETPEVEEPEPENAVEVDSVNLPDTSNYSPYRLSRKAYRKKRSTITDLS